MSKIKKYFRRYCEWRPEMAARPEIVKEYEETEKEYMKIYEQDCDQMEKLTKQMEALTCRRAYGKEGTIHRGYY